MQSEPSSRQQRLQELIEEFLQARLSAKLEKDSSDNPKADELRAQFKMGTWLENASKRVKQIRIVTHIVKAMHPDAKGSELYCRAQTLPLTDQLSSFHLDRSVHDVTGNAAALDVYKFLSLTFEDYTLLELMEARDSDLLAALSSNSETAESWVESFTGLKEPDQNPSSHTFAKQVYWLCGEDSSDNSQYHLLAPLFASPLAQRVHETLQNHRFGDEAKAARNARKEKVYSETTVYEYRGLAVRKLGGSKPQNISQLNSLRGGNNFLLASVPPEWQFTSIRLPMGNRPLFQQFGFRSGVKELLRELKDFLESNPSGNLETKDKRDAMVSAIIDKVIEYTAELHSLDAGWSKDPRCRLTDAEKLWLDPGRADFEPLFATARDEDDWQSEVAAAFARWLNASLENPLMFGDVEHQFWSEMFEDEIFSTTEPRTVKETKDASR